MLCPLWRTARRRGILLPAMNSFTRVLSSHKRTLYALLAVFLFSTTVTLAVPPSTPYNSGETLDPNCAPGDANCFVTPVAIGTAVGSATSGSLLFVGAGGVLAQDNASLFYNATTHMVGIGTTSPISPLTVYSPDLRGLRVISSEALGSVSGGGVSVNTSTTPTAANQRLGGLYFGSTDDTTGRINTGASIEARSSEAWTSTSSGGSLRFLTASNGGNMRFERMRIDENGNIGIGTMTPVTNLHVRGLTGLRIEGTGTNTNIIDVVAGVAATVDRLDFRSLRPNRGVEFQLNPNGTSTNSKIGLANAESSTVFGSLFISVENTQANISSQTSGAGVPVTSLVFGGGTSAIDWSTISFATGLVGIGTTAPSYLLHVGSPSIVGTVARFENSTGTCDINPTATALSCSSDMNLKKDIELLSDDTDWSFNDSVTLDNKSILSRLLALQPVRYHWNSEDSTDDLHAGFIAQDVEQIFPDLVTQDKDTDLLSLNYMGLLPYTVSAIQELDIKIAALPQYEDEEFTERLATFFKGVAERGEGLFTKVKTKELCVDDVCVTRDQFIRMVEHAGGDTSGSENSDMEQEETSETEEIQPEEVPVIDQPSNDNESVEEDTPEVLVELPPDFPLSTE